MIIPVKLILVPQRSVSLVGMIQGLDFCPRLSNQWNGENYPSYYFWQFIVYFDS